MFYLILIHGDTHRAGICALTTFIRCLETLKIEAMSLSLYSCWANAQISSALLCERWLFIPFVIVGVVIKTMVYYLDLFVNINYVHKSIQGYPHRNDPRL